MMNPIPNQDSLCTVLISSIGRRSQLISCFEQAFKRLGLRGRVIGMDANPSQAPAAHLVQRCFPVPRCDDPAFVDRVLAICKEERVTLVVPAIDPELPVYAAAREKFLSQGVHVAISGPRTVQIARDKAETNAWLRSKNLPTIWQGRAEEVVKAPEGCPLPLIVKPRGGSASIGVTKVNSYAMLRAVLASGGDLVVEEFAPGHEYTINVLVDKEGRCVCAVPHRRIEVRAGEVSKGITVKDAHLMQLGKQVAESLPDPFGPLNIQCFKQDSGPALVTEINARFGGGFPLANEAGAAFPAWMLEEILGLPSTAQFDAWTDKLTMLRYDCAVFLKD
jgi:carbamoyl-phosphate synthase large subunit